MVLSEDIQHHEQLMLCGIDAGFNEEFTTRALIDIEDRIVSMDGNSLQTYSLHYVRRMSSNGMLPSPMAL